MSNTLVLKLQKQRRIYTALRPHLHEFLEAVSQKYELVIYTAAEVREPAFLKNIIFNILLCHIEMLRRQMYQPV